MNDLRTDFDRFIEGMERVSLLAQLRDKVIEAQDTFKPECGNLDGGQFNGRKVCWINTMF